MASLRVTNGPSAGRRVDVRAEVTVGREGADLVIEDPEMSRRHAVVRLVSGAIEVEDLGSSNGTFVSGARIDGPTRVNGGGEIRCGTTVFQVLGVVPAQGTRISTSAEPHSALAAPQTTRVRPAPAAPALAAPGQILSGAVGTFSPPVPRRSRGLASRSWVPVALSFGTVVVVAVALVIYFAAR